MAGLGRPRAELRKRERRPPAQAGRARPFVAALVLYFDDGYSWLLLILLILAPDLSFLAYAAGPRVGAALYNSLHNMVLPIALGIVGVLGDSRLATAIALIWLAHIGIDRALGYGLKYPTAFKDTHIQRV